MDLTGSEKHWSATVGKGFDLGCFVLMLNKNAALFKLVIYYHIQIVENKQDKWTKND